MMNVLLGSRALLGVVGLACFGVVLPALAEPPDLTGVWTNYRSPGGAGRVRGARAQLPLTPEAKAKADRYVEVTTGTNYTPGGYCVGGGMPGSMLGSGGYPMEIIQRPEQITVVYEAHNEVRRIYFGDRAPDPATMFPERNGFSVGRWDGDTLIVVTSHLVEQVDTAYPHSEEARIVEEYRLSEENGLRVLTATMTMTDTEFLTAPFTMEKKWQELPNGHVRTYECTEPDWLDLLDRLMKETDAGGATEARGE
jgi:hypothetical protein